MTNWEIWAIMEEHCTDTRRALLACKEGRRRRAAVRSRRDRARRVDAAMLVRHGVDRLRARDKRAVAHPALHHGELIPFGGGGAP